MNTLPSLIAVIAIIILAATTCDAAWPYMQLVKVKNARARNAVANDGTDGAYYVLPSLDANSTTKKGSFVIQLEGGWSCNPQTPGGANGSCEMRFAQDCKLMSSSCLTATRSPDLFNTINPIKSAFWDFHQVYLPYITSDFWVGNQSATNLSKYEFRGWPLVKAIIEDLQDGVTLDNGEVVTLKSAVNVVWTGFSAGGIGASLTGRRVEKMIKAKAPNCNFKVIPDSGLFLGDIPDPLENYTKAQCEKFNQRCSYKEEWEDGYAGWNAQLDPDCLSLMQALGKKPYQCAFGTVAPRFSSMKMSDTFWLSYIWDAAGMLADGIFKPEMNQTDVLQFALELAAARFEVFKQVPSFAPSCIGHVAIGFADKFSIDGVLLRDAMSDFFFLGSKKSYLNKSPLQFNPAGCYPKL